MGATARYVLGRALGWWRRGRVRARVFYPAQAGKNAQVMGGPDQPKTFSYTPGIAAGLATLGARDEADGRVWHLPNAPTATTRDFVDKISEAAGTDSSVSPMPPFMVNLVALFNGNVREIKEVLYQLEEPFVVDSTAFESTFDQLVTPLEEFVPGTVDWFRAHPK